MKFTVKWIGVSVTVWENPSNRSFNALPDANTDVYINAGMPRYPGINTNVFCWKLNLLPDTSIEVKPGKKLAITGKNSWHFLLFLAGISN